MAAGAATVCKRVRRKQTSSRKRCVHVLAFGSTRKALLLYLLPGLYLIYSRRDEVPVIWPCYPITAKHVPKGRDEDGCCLNRRSDKINNILKPTTR